MAWIKACISNVGGKEWPCYCGLWPQLLLLLPPPPSSGNVGSCSRLELVFVFRPRPRSGKKRGSSDFLFEVIELGSALWWFIADDFHNNVLQPFFICVWRLSKENKTAAAKALFFTKYHESIKRSHRSNGNTTAMMAQNRNSITWFVRVNRKDQLIFYNRGLDCSISCERKPPGFKRHKKGN